MRIDQGLRGEYARAADFMDAMHRMHRIWGALNTATELKRGDMMMLGAVMREESHGTKPITASALARRTHQSLPGVSQRLNQLEESGYLRRSGDAEDRRVVHVQLTDKGRKATQKAMLAMLAHMEQALGTLGDADAATLLQLMQRLVAAFEAENDNRDRNEKRS